MHLPMSRARPYPFQIGHQLIQDVFGPAHLPTHGWSIDPFGESMFVPQLLPK